MLRFLPASAACVRALALGSVMLALLAPSAHAQWKWRDANGRIVVSDVPPPLAVPEKDVLQRPQQVVPRSAPAASAPAVAASVAASTPTDPELENRKRRGEQEQQAQEQAQRKAEEAKNAAARKDNCERARNQLALIDSGQRIVRMGANGEREFLTDAQRAQEAQRARGIIASDCR